MARIHFENGSYRTAGELPPVGSRAADFSLVDTRLKTVSLANWAGMRKVLNIFVSVDTEVCAKSVIEFDRRAEGHDDIAMLMVSYDLPFALRRFLSENRLQHVNGLSAIRHQAFGDNYGVQIVDGPLEGMFARAVVVLDENNTVVHEQLIEDILTEPDYDSAMRALGIDDTEGD